MAARIAQVARRRTVRAVLVHQPLNDPTDDRQDARAESVDLFLEDALRRSWRARRRS